MEMQNMKNIIVLRDLPSNMIEEAFVVLKSNVKVHKKQTIGEQEKRINSTKVNSKYIVREAEMLVTDYMERYVQNDQKKKKKKHQLEKKYKKLKTITLFLTGLIIMLIMGMLFS